MRALKLVIVLAVCGALGFGFAACLSAPVEVAVVDVQLPTLSVQP